MNSPHTLNLRRHRRPLILSIVLAAALYLGFSVYWGWSAVWAAVGRIGVAGMLVALTLSLVNYSLRFLRWRGYLRTLGHPLPWRTNLNIYLAGFALTTTPGKSGEMVRSLLLKRHGMGYSASVAAFFAERVSDLMALLLLLALGGLAHPKAWVVSLATVLLVAGLMLVLGRPAIIKRIHLWFRTRGWDRIAHLLSMGLRVADHFRLCSRSKTLWVSLFLGSLAWCAEASGFFVIIHLAVGGGLSWEQAVFIYAFATLVGALSFLPGGLGGAEAAMLALLVSSGVGEQEAVAITVVARMTTLWFGVGIGSVALASSARKKDSGSEGGTTVS